MSKQHEAIEKCSNPDCGGTCIICNCFVCKHCGLYEGALTTHCPEKNVTSEQSELVYAGKLNYRGGIWIEGECSEHTPVFMHKHSKEWDEQHGI